jgi:NAD(P)H-dependent flavin oxidoreductase YrpB (nitropropane dioxygenase family)
LAEGAPILCFSWGDDAQLVARARDVGAFVLVQVGGLAEAVRAGQARADALIVQGVEAGGHVQSTVPLVQLVGQLRSQIGIPLVAAGGLADAASIRDALDSRADAVACGTAFLAANEANVHATYLDRLIRASADDTTLTTTFDGGWPSAPHRVVRNETVDLWEAAGMPDHGSRPGEGDLLATRNGKPVLRYEFAQPTKETTGDVAQMALYAGTSIDAVNRAEPAANITGRLISSL